MPRERGLRDSGDNPDALRRHGAGTSGDRVSPGPPVTAQQHHSGLFGVSSRNGRQRTPPRWPCRDTSGMRCAAVV